MQAAKDLSAELPVDIPREISVPKSGYVQDYMPQEVCLEELAGFSKMLILSNQPRIECKN